jgi:hypothetical protein
VSPEWTAVFAVFTLRVLRFAFDSQLVAGVLCIAPVLTYPAVRDPSHAARVKAAPRTLTEDGVRCANVSA